MPEQERTPTSGAVGALGNDVQADKLNATSVTSQDVAQARPQLHDEIGGKYPVRDIALDSIFEPAERMRELRPAKVDEIASSMAEIGQLSPIIVRPRAQGGYFLAAGRHRLRAAKKLKRPAIKCYVRDDLDAERALLVEIDENLKRADLTSEEKATHLHLRKELWEQRQAEISRTEVRDIPRGRGRPKGFVSAEAERTGKSKRAIQKQLAGKKPKQEKWLGPETGKRVEPNKSTATDADAARANDLVLAWNQASTSVRRWFVESMFSAAMPPTTESTVTIDLGIEAARAHYAMHIIAITDRDERHAEYHKLKFELAGADAAAGNADAAAEAKRLISPPIDGVDDEFGDIPPFLDRRRQNQGTSDDAPFPQMESPDD